MDLQRQMSLPLRYPDETDPRFMTKRARWFVVLGFLLPGSVQILAGKKALGRFAMVATWLLLAGVAAFGVGLWQFRVQTLNLLGQQWFLTALQVALGCYLLMWLILGFDTMRLLRLTRVRGNWRAPLVFVTVLLTVLPVAAGLWGINLLQTSKQVVSEVFAERPAVSPDENGRYNILLLGTDAGADREGVRPDSITLVSIDAATGKSVFVGLPRELNEPQFKPSSPLYSIYPEGFGAIDGCNTGRCWLNSLFSEGEIFLPELYPDATAHGSSPGIEATKDGVAGSTGLDIHFYVLLNMEGFQELIDALGGVEINVTEPLPIGGDEFGNGVEGYVEPGLRRLSGYEALWYARSRYGSERGDYDRMERQRELQAAILAQMDPRNVLLRFEAILQSGTHVAETDVPNNMIGTLTDLALRAKQHEPVRVELSPPEIITEAPDYDRIREMVREAIVQASGSDENGQ
ncbi:LytR family transcriptional regulator [Leucobacter sp. OH2974_COT-288]|nr:LytR family transcriptional regulator [Leucobacter sp. OH2974_COT-288]